MFAIKTYHNQFLLFDIQSQNLLQGSLLPEVNSGSVTHVFFAPSRVEKNMGEGICLFTQTTIKFI